MIYEKDLAKQVPVKIGSEESKRWVVENRRVRLAVINKVPKICYLSGIHWINMHRSLSLFFCRENLEPTQEEP